MANAPWNGIARKIVLPLIAVSAVGWLIYVVGAGVLFSKENDVAINFGFYVAAVIGPFMYIGAVVHAAFWRQISSILGSVIAVLSFVYFTAMGYVLYTAGLIIYESHMYAGSNPLESSFAVTFSGGFIACLFWAVVLAMWPWYSPGARTHEPLPEAIRMNTRTNN